MRYLDLITGPSEERMIEAQPQYDNYDIHDLPGMDRGALYGRLGEIYAGDDFDSPEMREERHRINQTIYERFYRGIGADV